MRKYLIGVIAGLASVVALSSVASVASADVVGLRIDFSATPSKQNKKTRGPVHISFESDETFAGPFGGAAPGFYAYPPSVHDFITFPPDLKFDPGKMPDCNLASLVGKSTANAVATCPKSVVGSGQNIQVFSDGTARTGTITVFNGAPSGGNPSIYVFDDIPGVQTKPILNGVIRGNTVDVQIPPVGGSVIDDLKLTLNPLVTRKKKNKKTGKVQKSFYVSMKCSRKQWSATEHVTYQNGQTEDASHAVPCKQKK